MTETYVRKAFKFWQTVCGLDAWSIELILGDGVDGDPTAEASIWMSQTYDRAIMRLCDDWATRDKDWINETLVHEFMHIHERDLKCAIESVYDQLAPAISDMYDDRVHHEREGLVDRLAMVIVGSVPHP
jgi:hypothetical protein